MKTFATDNLRIYNMLECMHENGNGAEWKENASESLEMNLHFRMCDNGKKMKVESENVIQLICSNRLRKVVNTLFLERESYI